MRRSVSAQQRRHLVSQFWVFLRRARKEALSLRDRLLEDLLEQCDNVFPAIALHLRGRLGLTR